VSVHIRQVGDWTQALGERVGATPAVIQTISQGTEEVRDRKSSTMQDGHGAYVELDPNAGGRPLPVVRIDGPYGAPAEDVFRSEVAILIGAGIGVAPFASILKRARTYFCGVCQGTYFHGCNSLMLHLLYSPTPWPR